MSEEYKTEEQLKKEALERKKHEAKIASLKPQKTDGQKKRENFWYHYKWHTIGITLASVLIIWFVGDVVFRVDPDITVIAMLSEYVSEESSALLENYIGEVGGDFNGDGKNIASIDFIQPPNQGDNLDYANNMKITTVIAASIDPVFLLDKESYDALFDMAGDSMFEEISVPCDFIDIPELDGAAFYIRKREVFEKSAAYYEYCENLLKSIDGE